MSDRELLEAAAKAAGIVGAWGEIESVGLTDGGCNVWDPLNDDGDALRLAVMMNIEVGWENNGAVVFADNCSEPAEADPAGATRRAIVRAAAMLTPSA